MKTLIYALTVGFVVTGTLASSFGQNFVVPVYARYDDHVYFVKAWHTFSFLGREETKDSRNVATKAVDQGSAWCADVNGKRVLVTAAHILGIKTCTFDGFEGELKKQIESDTWVAKILEVQRTSRVVVGGLAYEPSKIAWPSLGGASSDACFLYMEDDAVFSRIKPIAIANKLPAVSESVDCYGFPGTTDQQVETITVSSVDQQSGYFTLNKPVDNGYSGGLVMSKGKEAYGVIVGTAPNGKQTIALLVTEKLLRSTAPQPASKVLKNTFTP